MNKASSRQQDCQIDLIRGIAIMGVVGIHFGGSFVTKEYVWTGPFYVGLFLSEVSSFAVPAFVFLSGWGLGMRYGSGPVEYLSFYRRRLITIGIPYLIASAIWFQLLKGQPPFMGQGLFALLFYYGIQPTLFFIPLLMQLYILYPFFRFILHKLAYNICAPRPTITLGVLGFLAGLLLVHIILGYLSYKNLVDYYTFCRPFSPFWAFYFVSGMYFSTLNKSYAYKFELKKALPLLSVTILALGMADATGLLDVKQVGFSFEHTDTYYAYSRPIIMAYNLLCLIVIMLLLWSKQSFRCAPLQLFGRFSLYIYLFHLMVLGRFVWGDPYIIEYCKESPIVIVLIVIGVCAAIGIPAQLVSIAVSFIRTELREKLSRRQLGA